KFEGKESVHTFQDLPLGLRRGYLPPQVSAIANAVREPTRELLHLSNCVGPPRVTQVAEISRKQLIAIAIRGLLIAARSDKLLDLAEDPWIGAGPAPNHYGIAARLAYHPQGIFGRPNIAIADDGYLHSLLDGANQAPTRRSAISLRARSGMYRNGLHADSFRHPRNFY